MLLGIPFQLTLLTMYFQDKRARKVREGIAKQKCSLESRFSLTSRKLRETLLHDFYHSCSYLETKGLASCMCIYQLLTLGKETGNLLKQLPVAKGNSPKESTVNLQQATLIATGFNKGSTDRHQKCSVYFIELARVQPYLIIHTHTYSLLYPRQCQYFWRQKYINLYI